MGAPTLRCARKVMPSMASPLHGSGRGGRPCLGGSCFVGVGVRRARGELHGGMLADGPPHLPVGVLGGNRAAPPPRVPVASSGLWVSTLGSTQKQALQANGRGGGEYHAEPSRRTGFPGPRGWGGGGAPAAACPGYLCAAGGPAASGHQLSSEHSGPSPVCVLSCES